jgi:predicted transcriptional regulator
MLLGNDVGQEKQVTKPDHYHYSLSDGVLLVDHRRNTGAKNAAEFTCCQGQLSKCTVTCVCGAHML